MSAELDRTSGMCTFCGREWDERHEKYGCPEETEVHAGYDC